MSRRINSCSFCAAFLRLNCFRDLLPPLGHSTHSFPCLLNDDSTAQEYTDRKIVTLKENAQLAQRALMVKRSDYQAVTSTLQMRMSQMQQARK